MGLAAKFRELLCPSVAQVASNPEPPLIMLGTPYSDGYQDGRFRYGEPNDADGNTGNLVHDAWVARGGHAADAIDYRNRQIPDTNSPGFQTYARLYAEGMANGLAARRLEIGRNTAFHLIPEATFCPYCGRHLRGLVGAGDSGT